MAQTRRRSSEYPDSRGFGGTVHVDLSTRFGAGETTVSVEFLKVEGWLLGAVVWKIILLVGCVGVFGLGLEGGMAG
ncbi:hypothetical protein N8D56_20825 [Devosia sp. A8/3-2]|nr:hypothetical protein N8D56_20825 [Devosia sp. A8/3-2]